MPISAEWKNVSAPDTAGLVNTLQETDPFAQATSSLTQIFENQQKRLEKRRTTEAQANIRDIGNLKNLTSAERQKAIQDVAYGADIDESAVFATADKQKDILTQEVSQEALSGALTRADSDFDTVAARNTFAQNLLDSGVDAETVSKKVNEVQGVLDIRQAQYDEQIGENTESFLAENRGQITNYDDLFALADKADQERTGSAQINKDQFIADAEQQLSWMDRSEERARAVKNRNDLEEYGTKIDDMLRDGDSEQAVQDMIAKSGANQKIQGELLTLLNQRADTYAELDDTQAAELQGFANQIDVTYQRDAENLNQELNKYQATYESNNDLNDDKRAQIESTYTLSGTSNNNFIKQLSQGFGSLWDIFRIGNQQTIAEEAISSGINDLTNEGISSEDARALSVLAVEFMEAQENRDTFDTKIYANQLTALSGRYAKAQNTATRMQKMQSKGQMLLDEYRLNTQQKLLETKVTLRESNRGHKKLSASQFQSDFQGQTGVGQLIREETAEIEKWNNLDTLDTSIANQEQAIKDSAAVLTEQENITRLSEDNQYITGSILGTAAAANRQSNAETALTESQRIKAAIEAQEGELNTTKEQRRRLYESLGIPEHQRN